MLVGITYFKPSGKYYCDAEEVKLDIAENRSFAIPDVVKGLRDEGKLPGLASGTWDGPILVVEISSGLPFLILPERLAGV